MASRLSIENDRLKVGQVKRVTSNNGNKIDSITLLLNESVEVLFAPNGNTLEFTVSNPNIDMSNLDCTIDKETLRDLVISFKDAYNQIIANEIASVDIAVTSLGTADLTSEQEKELLANYNKYIEYSKIQFKGNIKLNNGVPEVTTDPKDDSTIVELEITDVTNERKLINEDLAFHFERDVTKYPDTVLNTVLDKKELYAQAQCVLFATKVKEAVTEKLAEIRALNNTFEGTTEYTL